MMECVVLVRMTDDCVVGIKSDDDDGAMEVFPHHDAAVAWAEESFLCRARPYQIVELDEL